MESQDGLSIVPMCELATVSRASFYRHWEEKAPTEAEMALRDAIQRIAVGHRFYGYRRVAVLVQREGYGVQEQHAGFGLLTASHHLRMVI
jgi:hypothetical protein